MDWVCDVLHVKFYKHSTDLAIDREYLNFNLQFVSWLLKLKQHARGKNLLGFRMHKVAGSAQRLVVIIRLPPVVVHRSIMPRFTAKLSAIQLFTAVFSVHSAIFSLIGVRVYLFISRESIGTNYVSGLSQFYFTSSLVELLFCGKSASADQLSIISAHAIHRLRAAANSLLLLLYRVPRSFDGQHTFFIYIIFVVISNCHRRAVSL